MNHTTGQLPEPSSPRPRRSGVAGMVLAGVASGCLLVWFTGDRVFNSEASGSTIIVQHTLLVCAIAGALWVTRQRPWRAFALSLVVFWALTLVLAALPWDDPEGAGSPGGSRSLPVATKAS
jgi:peptidoglycan/LPS O-acetylase OafA/YrhL